MSTEEINGWFYVNQNREKQGPYSVAEFKALADDGIIRAETLIWSHGYENWLPARELAGLISNLEEASTPPPSQPEAKAEPETKPDSKTETQAQAEAKPIVTPQEGDKEEPTPATSPPSSSSPAPDSLAQPASPASQIESSSQPIKEPSSPASTTEAAAPSSKPKALPDVELKPRKGSFLFARILRGTLISLILGAATAVGCALAGLTPFIGLAAFALFLGFFIYLGLVAFRKERYEMTESNVICHQGSLTSDRTTDIDICNITHVELTLPWLRHKLFGIGTVAIHSAGNAQPIVFRAIKKPLETYEQVQTRLKLNGYQLEQKELLHEESPALIGILLNMVRIAFGLFVIFSLISSSLVGAFSEIDSAGLHSLLPIVSIVLLIIMIASLIILFLDMRKRTYRVYDDVVTYEKGFLTRVKAFIPYENIADAATNRTFIDRLLNLYEVVISCQGSSKEIKFQFLKNGIFLTECIEKLITAANSKPSPAERLQNSESSTSTLSTRKEPSLIRPEEAWIADLKMHGMRVFLPLLILIPVFPLFIAVMIRSFIRVHCTSYTVRSGFIGHSFRFLNTVDREFAYDKITGLVVKENLFDRMFGTFTLRFWSIGSSQSLELAHVHHSQVDLDSLLKQIGIPTEYEHAREIPTKFSPLSWLRAHCYGLFATLLLAIGAALTAFFLEENIVYAVSGVIFIIPLINFVHSWIFYSKQAVSLHDHHIEAVQGIISRHSYFTRYRNIKKSLTTVYPGGSNGSLKIFAAGEQTLGVQVQQSETKGQAKTVMPCSFTLGFLPDVLQQSQFLDDVLAGRAEVQDESKSPEPATLIAESKRGLGNSLVTLIIGSIILFPLLPFLIFTLPLTILSIKRWRYRLEAGRIVSSWGLLFKKQESILLDRVDSQQQQQGLLGKMFKNGTVKIMTAGSSQPDLVMNAAVSYQTLSQEIKKITKKS